MKKRYFTIGIALALLLAGGLDRAEAWQRHFVSDYAGTGVNGAIDTNGDGRTASVVTGIANTTLGRFLFQSEVEFLPVPRVTCPAGTVELSLVQAHAVLTHQRTAHKGRFFLKALSFLSFWLPACAGMTKAVCCSTARHARVGGQPGFSFLSWGSKTYP